MNAQFSELLGRIRSKTIKFVNFLIPLLMWYRADGFDSYVKDMDSFSRQPIIVIFSYLVGFSVTSYSYYFLLKNTERQNKLKTTFILFLLIALALVIDAVVILVALYFY